MKKKQNPKNATTAWWDDPRLVELIGRAAFLKIEALGWVINPDGRSLASIAAAHGAKRQLLSRYASRVSAIYGISNSAQIAARARTKL